MAFQQSAFQNSAFQNAGIGPVPVGGTSGGTSNSGPDAQVSFSDYMRRFGAKSPKRLPVYIDDEEAIVLLLCAIAADAYH